MRDEDVRLKDKNFGRSLNFSNFRYGSDYYSCYLSHAYLSIKEKNSLFSQVSQPYLRLWQKYYGKADPSFSILKNNGTIANGYRAEIDGIEYMFCKDANQHVDFISCSDTSFQTDGLKVGENFLSVTKKFWEMRVRHMRGCGHFIELPSGWNAATGWKEGTDTVTKDAKVQWFFKSTATVLSNNR